MTTYQRLVRRTAKIPDVHYTVTQIVENEVKSALHLLDAVRRYERKELPESVHYHGTEDVSYYDTAIKLGLLEKREPPVGRVNRWPILVSTQSGRRIHHALEKQGYDLSPPK